MPFPYVFEYYHRIYRLHQDKDPDCWLPDGEILIFRKEESNLPPYIPVSRFVTDIAKAQEGDYVETLDGYIVPILQVKGFKRKGNDDIGFRFAIQVNTYAALSAIKRGSYFPVFNRHYAKYVKAGNREKAYGLLNHFEREFCWRTATTMNPVQTVLEMGNWSEPIGAEFMAKQLISKKKFATVS